MIVFSPGTTEYVTVAVSTEEDPTDWPAEIGFSDEEDVPPDTWHDAGWKDGFGSDKVDGRYRKVWYVQVLVGPVGDVTLAEGTWYVWLKADTGAEVPVRMVGSLVIK
ncbi:MAG: hypothetical protein E6R03_12785 [Hyphomicrobiaceae bacterium]|nr:MAG: hypothetical protein E6R03_12785 [Hyphomicrobiaceae bacterium]